MERGFSVNLKSFSLSKLKRFKLITEVSS
jgi:hypothetical protein